MVSPARKREAVAHTCRRLSVSQRRACTTLKQPRTTQRYQPKVSEENKRLTKRIHQLARKNPRYGYRRITALLRREGWRVNHKRVQRIWRKEGLKLPSRKQIKRKRTTPQQTSPIPHRAEHINHIWSYDFIFARSSDGRPLKTLCIVDEYTRESLAIEIERKLTHLEVTRTLARVIRQRGAEPAYIRSDNGSEFIASKLQQWLSKNNIATHYIAPGSPWENPFIESFHNRLRDEFFCMEELGSLIEAKILVEQWRVNYNENHPHSALGYESPGAFAARCRTPVRPPASPPSDSAQVPTTNPVILS